MNDHDIYFSHHRFVNKFINFMLLFTPNQTHKVPQKFQLSNRDPTAYIKDMNKNKYEQIEYHEQVQSCSLPLNCNYFKVFLVLPSHPLYRNKFRVIRDTSQGFLNPQSCLTNPRWKICSTLLYFQ